MSRIHLLGRTAIESGELFDSSDFPGRQGRLLFSVLAWDRRRVSREVLVEILWPSGPPAAWDTSLSALLSKLRGLLQRAGFDAHRVLDATGGACEMRFPEGTWVDVREAVNSLDRAEGSLRRDAWEEAWSDTTVASSILGRSFLAGEDNPWVEARRIELAELSWRATDCLTRSWLERGDLVLATHSARRLVELAPYRESSYVRLMESHLAAGNRAEALRTYEEVRVLLGEQLGVDPTERIQRLYLAALG